MKLDHFLGKEFLTWLWFRVERDEGLIQCESGNIAVDMSQSLVLVTGGNIAETATLASDAPTQSEEARTALRAGKKVCKARLNLHLGERSYSATVDQYLALSGVRLPTLLSEGREDAALTVLQERMALLRELEGAVYGMYRAFLDVRMGPAWPVESQQIAQWVQDS